ncbi:MAG: esterase [Gammaproteobacteria bacterium]|nr:esterase [Gammaproteobacteria bacterium]
MTRFQQLTVVALITLLSACSGNLQYRTANDLCSGAEVINSCSKHTLQQYNDAGNPDKDYLLGFIEFDDQGQLHSREQMNAVIGKIAAETAEQDLLMVVFVHGWKHNADVNDSNITDFRNSLMRLSVLESKTSRAEGRKARKIAGVYLGWRGESIDVPYLDNITFWDRKSTAHKVGRGGVTEVLTRLEQIRRAKKQENPDGTEQPGNTRLVIIGHSFGGAIVYSALSQVLMTEFIKTSGNYGVSSHASGFGDLVVLINPAFEALRYAPLADMANERGTYFPGQLPVLAVLTSEADLATKWAFWAGRLFSTALEKHRTVNRYNRASKSEQSISQGSADRTAIGHFEPYMTHRLLPDNSPPGQSAPSVKQVMQGWQNDAPGGVIRFPGSKLKHLNNSVARNPYLIIQVDKEIIPGHSEIYDPRVADFLSHFVLLSTQSN